MGTGLRGVFEMEGLSTCRGTGDCGFLGRSLLKLQPKVSLVTCISY